MTRDDKLSGNTYERWTDNRFAICRYSWWDGKQGTFFVAYDHSKRITPKPVSTFDEALTYCNVRRAA